MERLTKRLSNGATSWNYQSDCYGEDETRNKVFRSVHRQNACEKLAAYEDTGLEPEDIKRAFNEAAVLKLAGQALGITPDRLRELAQADKEGRCVVLPCKIGDIVYEIRYTAENNSPRKYARKIFDCSVSVCTWRMREQPDMCYVSEKKCTKSDFAFMGRTVFLTREEAEAALEGMKDAD